MASMARSVSSTLEPIRKEHAQADKTRWLSAWEDMISTYYKVTRVILQVLTAKMNTKVASTLLLYFKKMFYIFAFIHA